MAEDVSWINRVHRMLADGGGVAYPSPNSEADLSIRAAGGDANAQNAIANLRKLRQQSSPITPADLRVRAVQGDRDAQDAVANIDRDRAATSAQPVATMANGRGALRRPYFGER